MLTSKLGSYIFSYFIEVKLRWISNQHIGESFCPTLHVRCWETRSATDIIGLGCMVSMWSHPLRRWKGCSIACKWLFLDMASVYPNPSIGSHLDWVNPPTCRDFILFYRSLVIHGGWVYKGTTNPDPYIVVSIQHHRYNLFDFYIFSVGM